MVIGFFKWICGIRKCLLRLWYPYSFVSDIWHIGEKSETMTRLAFNQLVYVPNEGHLVFKIWSREATSYKWYVLSAKHVCTALGIWNAATLWAFNNVAMAKMLMRYVDDKKSVPFIFALMINGRDSLKQLRSYIKTFEIPENVSPRVIEVLYHFHKNQGVGAGAVDFYIIDYEMNELRFCREDFIAPRS